MTLPGVFTPHRDAHLLAAAIARESLPRDAHVVEVGTGSGFVAIVVARTHGARVTAVDVSRRALLNAALNARLNGVRLTTARGDLLAPLAGERVDAIVSNPPYLPAADGPAAHGGGDGDALPARGAARAWEGGRDGRALLDRLCDQARAHLRPGGVLLLVQSSVCGEQATLDRLAAGGLGAGVVARHRGPLGPLLAARAAALERRGILAPGQREEELLVIRARAGGQ